MVDDELVKFVEDGALPLPTDGVEGRVENEGASIWYASFGDGPAVILLHGGLGHSGNWGYQVPSLVAAGYRAVVIDSRGHGRSTRDARPYSYELMASDVIAVMDVLGVGRAALVGWSDGACTAMVVGMQVPERVAGVYFFGCNMDPNGTKEIEFASVLQRCFARHQADYAALSATPDDFESFGDAVGLMQQTEPNYTAADLAKVAVPVWIVLAERDEFIKREHAEYLAASIPGAELRIMEGVSHFAPLQRPGVFDSSVLEFLGSPSGPVAPVPKSGT